MFVYLSYNITSFNRLTPTVTGLSRHFDIRALWRSAVSVRVPGCQKLQMTG